MEETEEKHRHDNCVYLPGSDIHDHVISTLAYENGVKASLFWAIFGPRGSKNGETLELVGSKGRMILTRSAAEIDLVTDYGERREVIDCKGPEHKTSHYGADRQMVRDIRRFVDGLDPIVSAWDGYLSTRMIMATHKSVDSGGDTVWMKDMPAARTGASSA
jgi:predicted dehydrogenase